MVSTLVLTLLLVFMVHFYSNFLLSSMNWIVANPLLSPLSIEPEWYFLSLYSILRVVMNKTFGILLLMLIVVGLILLPLIRFNELVFYTEKSWWFGVLLVLWCVNVLLGFQSFLELIFLANLPLEQPFLSICRFDVF